MLVGFTLIALGLFFFIALVDMVDILPSHEDGEREQLVTDLCRLPAPDVGQGCRCVEGRGLRAVRRPVPRPVGRPHRDRHGPRHVLRGRPVAGCA